MGLKGFGVWKTSDGGSTWNQLSSSTGFKWIDTIIVRDEGGVGAVYVGGGRSLSEGEYTGINGLQKSTDGGATWTEVLGEIAAGSSHHVTDLEIDSNNRLIVVLEQILLEMVVVKSSTVMMVLFLVPTPLAH